MTSPSEIPSPTELLRNALLKLFYHVPFGNPEFLAEHHERLEARAQKSAKDTTDEVMRLIELFGTHAALERQNKELREALEICLGHLTGGMDGNWADCDPAQKARAALAQALPELPTTKGE